MSKNKCIYKLTKKMLKTTIFNTICIRRSCVRKVSIVHFTIEIMLCNVHIAYYLSILLMLILVQNILCASTLSYTKQQFEHIQKEKRFNFFENLIGFNTTTHTETPHRAYITCQNRCLYDWNCIMSIAWIEHCPMTLHVLFGDELWITQQDLLWYF